MELMRRRFGVLALLLCLALAGSDAASSRSAEEYWRSIWPDTSMPENLEHPLGSSVGDAENKDNTQYPYSSFFEHDLHAGKQMHIIFNSPYADEEQKSNPTEKDPEKSSWKRNTMNEDSEKSESHQPWGVGHWKRSTRNKDPEKSASFQPWGVGHWKRSAMNEDSEKPASSQPWDVGHWKRSTMNEDSEKLASSQPWGVGHWKRSPMNEDSEKSATSQPWGVGHWKRNTIKNVHEHLSMEAICDTKERFVGEDDKFCAESVGSLIDFVVSKLGKDIEALTSSFVPHQTQYKMLEGIQRVSSEGVMCHKLNFKKPLFYCHQVNATITYIVPMEASDGTRTSIVALCHRDTRGLDPHKLFHQLKVKPGTVPVCHFLGSGAISWVPRNNELKAAFRAS